MEGDQVKSKVSFAWGCIAGIALMGCAGVAFPYRWYYPELVSYDGKLLASKPENDLQASVCAKDAQGEHGCVVMLKKDFKALVLDYMDTKDQLIECQKGSN